MTKYRKINLGDLVVHVSSGLDDSAYISLTDMAKQGSGGEDRIRNWMRNKNTLEFLGIWEQINNPDFKPVEFDRFRNEAGSNSFTMRPQKWIEATSAIGITSKSGRYGGTYAHEDIAFEFATWLSPAFKLLLITEFKRLKQIENSKLNLEWNTRRLLAKTNYNLHTRAVKDFILPDSVLPKDRQGIEYANEAELLNSAVFGLTSQEWLQANPKAVLEKKNLRDMASINELVVLSNIEAFNSEFIKMKVEREKRRVILAKIAQEQLENLNRDEARVKSLKRTAEDLYLEDKSDSQPDSGNDNAGGSSREDKGR